MEYQFVTRNAVQHLEHETPMWHLSAIGSQTTACGWHVSVGWTIHPVAADSPAGRICEACKSAVIKTVVS